jgi:cobalt-zinc-cadmium efflux system membrane fusion protein
MQAWLTAIPLRLSIFATLQRMLMHETTRAAPVEQGHRHVSPRSSSYPATPIAGEHPSHPALWQRVIGIGIVLVILVGFCLYVLGVQFPGLYGRGNDETPGAGGTANSSSLPGVLLIKDKPHTLEVPESVRETLGIRKGNQDLLAEARTPTTMRPLQLAGSTALDPIRLARIRARFAPCRVVKIGQVHDFSPKTGQSEFRELRPGDRVKKGDVLGIFYSVDVGSKKNDLLDALVQLILDQKILDQTNKHPEAVPQVFILTQERQVQGDRNAINRALNNLKVWDIPQEEIDSLQEEANKIAADKNAWFKTPEGRWVKGEKQTKKSDPNNPEENPWGKVTLRAPFDGVIVERNLHVDEMVVDNTVNLFQVADVDRLLVIANAPEDELPTLENLEDRRWTVRTVGASPVTGLPGTIDEIGYLIDPNQHTAVIKGYVQNPGQRIRAGQYVAAAVNVPPPAGVVEIPIDALNDDGRQSLVFVQTDPAKAQYTMRRVQVTHRFDHRVFVRSTPIPKQEQRTPQEAEEGLLPREPLTPGERVLATGVGELKAELVNRESQPKE